MTRTKDLFLAAEHGRLDTFEDFAQNEDINIHRDENDNTLLFIATEKGHHELAHLLISKGADINAKNKYGETPLSHAAENGDIEVVRLLFTYEGIMEPDSYERAVSGAASNGYMHVLNLLLENINEAAKYVSAAIESAAQAKETSILSRLHERYHLHSNLGAAFSSALYLSALNGHVNLVEVLLDTYDIDINYKGPAGRTALHAATADGNTKIARLLLRMDEIDINAQDENKWTALHLAAETNHTEIIRLLLARLQLARDKSDTCINIQDKFGTTALHLATEKGHSETVALLLAMDMLDINAQDNLRRTALHLAAGKGDAEMLELLLQGAQIDLNVRDQYEQTAFGIAVSLDDIYLIDLFLRRDGFDFDAAGVPSNKVVCLAAKLGYRSLMNGLLDKECAACPGRTPLSWCAENDQEEALKILLYDKGTDANSKDGNGRTPLSLSSQNGHIRVVETLLQHNADANLKDGNGRTPLSYSSENGCSYVAEMLLQHNADANLKDDNGRTPLSLGSENGKTEVVKVLLRYNVDANSKDGSGRTSLSRSAENGHEEVMNVLLYYKADPILPDSDARTPLWWALKNGHATCAKLLTPIDTVTLLLLTQQGNQDATEFLLSFKPKLDQRNHYGRTALHLAALSGHLNIARSLILWGAETNPRDNYSMTPLQLAMQKKHTDIIQLLIQNNASMKGIMAKDWRDVYGRQKKDIILLSETPGGEQHLEFPEAFPTSEELFQTSTELKSRLYLLPTDEPNRAIWSKVPVTVAKQWPVGGHLQITEKINNNILDISISSWLSVNHILDISISSRLSVNRCRRASGHTRFSRIVWRAIQPTNPGSPWTSIAYFSTLPYGWIPHDGVDLFEQFLAHIKTQWLESCHNFGEHLSNERLEQLQLKGTSSSIIDCLANDARTLAVLRTILAGQISEAETFMNNYCAHYNANQVPQTLQKLLKDDFEIGINKKIEELDQIVRDLLQIEFAWVTIRETRIATHEARMSTKLGQNVMLLTYVSIFYLPLGFCAALWAIPNITDNGTRTPFIVTATMVSVVSLLVTFNMEKIATIIQRGYQYGRNYITSKWREMKGK